MPSPRKPANKYILGRRCPSRRSIGFPTPAQPTANDLITYQGDSHLITFAPTGTGKTSGPVITNALRHRGQLIVVDMKGEVYRETAEERRAMGQKVYVLDLRDGVPTDSLNPLDLAVRCGSEPAAIARSFAAELVERSENERERFWSDWSETMITGAVSWLLADCPLEERRISSLFDLFNDDDVVYRIGQLLDPNEIHDRCARAAFNSFLQLPERDTRPSVLGTVQSHLRLFDSELTRRLTNTSSMDVDALIAGEPMSIYIVVPPSRLHAYSPLLRMWLSGMILAMTQRENPPEDRTLMLCDEVGNLGRIEALLMATTLLRSWGLTIWTFWQNAAQLQKYGPQANTIIDNAGVIQVFSPSNRRMAEDFVNLIGGISADELMRIPDDHQVLLVNRKRQHARQVRYYSDNEFKRKRNSPKKENSGDKPAR